MKQLAESENYIINYEYEKVFLNIKKTGKRLLIGEFYGDPYTAIISKDESFCVIGGAGIIVYYLNEPYTEYRSDIPLSKQWTVWGCDDEDSIIWVEKIEQTEEKIIITTENNEQITIIV